MMNFLESNQAQIVFKSPPYEQTTLVSKVSNSYESISQKFNEFIPILTVIIKKTLTKKEAIKMVKFLTGISIKTNPLIKILSIIVIVYQIINGEKTKVNMTLLFYSIVATLMLYNVFPGQVNLSSISKIASSKLWYKYWFIYLQ